MATRDDSPSFVYCPRCDSVNARATLRGRDGACWCCGVQLGVPTPATAPATAPAVDVTHAVRAEIEGRPPEPVRLEPPSVPVYATRQDLAVRFGDGAIAGLARAAPSASDVRAAIARECDAIRAMLLAKNDAYGNSALDPIRVFSRADEREGLRVRIDDKLSRVARGHDAGEDVTLDLIGYLVLLRIAERRARGGGA